MGRTPEISAETPVSDGTGTNSLAAQERRLKVDGSHVRGPGRHLSRLRKAERAAIRELAVELNYFECPWPLKAAECPCDLHFIEYLKFNKVEGKTIFHFGTGEHHIVGKDNHQRGNPNEILGITVSKDEHQSYIDFIVGNPIAANSYKVIFADIYTLSSKMLPAFDLISLFHLAEYYDDRQYWGPEHISSARRLNSVYARLDDRQLLKLFVSKLNPHGKILFYKRSDAFVDKPYPAAILVNELISQGVLAVEDEYESLMICGHAGTKSP